jgi:hypothetical protein
VERFELVVKEQTQRTIVPRMNPTTSWHAIFSQSICHISTPNV